MDLPEAQKEFLSLVSKIKDVETSVRFHNWIKANWLYETMDEDLAEGTDEGTALLSQIAADLRHQLPLEAQLPSENITYPKTGHNKDCDPATTIHVDAFLYDDDLVDELCDDGKLPKNYCLSCGSKDIKPLTFISHSASKENLARIFRELLPPLNEKIVLDVGSRLGAVLYGAFVYSSASKIIGVEINQDLVSLSSSIVTKYGMKSRVEVMGGDVRDYAPVVSGADVVIMNNVFEFFAPPIVQRELWTFLHRSIKKGALLVCMPTLEQSFSALEGIAININEWVEEIGSCAATPMEDDEDDHLSAVGVGPSSVPETDQVKLYRVR